MENSIWSLIYISDDVILKCLIRFAKVNSNAASHSIAEE